MSRFEHMRKLPMQLFRSPKTLLVSPKTFIHKYPGIYLAGLTLFAFLGYAAVLIFPVLLLAGLASIYQALTVENAIDWMSLFIWLMVSALNGVVCYRCMQYKSVAPVGLTLMEEKAPELFNLVEQIGANVKGPKIHRIVITSDYQLDIVKTPYCALPVWSMNTLTIGLPALQCLSAKHFECLLARRLGQFSKRNNPIANWLYQLRAIWPQYRQSYSRQKTPGIEPLRWFFAVYAPLYASISVLAARRDELNGDRYAMELYNDEIVREMITTDAVCRHYLQSRYWPAVNKIAALETKAPPVPHRKMAAAVLANLKAENLKMLVNETVQTASNPKDPVPALQDRLQNIGHEHPFMNDFRDPSAAVRYLGAALLVVITVVDKLWLQTWLENRKKHDQQPQQKEHEQLMGVQASNP